MNTENVTWELRYHFAMNDWEVIGTYGTKREAMDKVNELAVDMHEENVADLVIVALPKNS